MPDQDQSIVALHDRGHASGRKAAELAAGVGIVLGAVLAVAGIVLFAPNPQATDGNEVLFVLACASSFVLPLLFGVGFYKLTMKKTFLRSRV
jgi:hypothetical protein